MGGMGGDMGAGGMGGDMGGGMAPAAGGGKVMKQGKGGGQEMDEEQMAAMAPMLKLTRIEQAMAGMLSEVLGSLGANPQQSLRAQFPVENPKGGKPFLLDFAIPPLKMAVECDGEIWHGQPEQQVDDQERDNLLAQRGWSVLRFDDKAIEESPQAIKQTLAAYVQSLMQKPQKHASANGNGKPVYLFSSKDGKLTDCRRSPDKYFSRLKVHQSDEFGQGTSEFAITDYRKQASSEVYKQ